jgi:hypothetical protein
MRLRVLLRGSGAQLRPRVPLFQVAVAHVLVERKALLFRKPARNHEPAHVASHADGRLGQRNVLADKQPLLTDRTDKAEPVNIEDLHAIIDNGGVGHG